MGYADLHVHSVNSYDGVCSIPAILKYVADKTDLNVIAITDHDSMDGLEEAKKLAPRYGIEVVPGCEISTSEGHLLALFIDRPVQPGLTLVETVKAVGRQGGLCIAAHPLAIGMDSLRFDTIWKALNDPEVKKYLVGIEAFNSSLVDTSQNQLVMNVSKSTSLALVANSDAHTLSAIGLGKTFFEGKTADDLRRSLINRSTEVRIGKVMNALQIVLDYLPRFLLRKLGWVVWNSNPRYPLTYAPLSKIAAGSH